MQISHPRVSIKTGVAYAPATVADALGISPDDLDDWLTRKKVDLPVLKLPDGSRRIPGAAVLRFMCGDVEDNHPLAKTGGQIAVDSLYTPDQTAEILGLAWKTLQEYRREGRGPRVTMVGALPRYRGKHILEWMEERANT